MGFRVGKFERSGVLRNLTPSETQVSLSDIDPAELAARGIKLVLLDVDNTLLPWREHEFPPQTLEWFERGRAAGLRFTLVSNTRNKARLASLASDLGVSTAQGKFKPSRTMYDNALTAAGVTPDEAVMIGDQIFTDVLGANRAGIAAIWIKPMTNREFFGTKFSRMMERVIGPAIYRAMVEAPGDLPIDKPKGLLANRGVRQFVKFGIVGGSSTVIDWGINFLLMLTLPTPTRPFGLILGEWLLAQGLWPFTLAHTPKGAALPVINTIAAGIAILNSFYWNRRWTFGVRGSEGRARQFGMFYVVAIIGLLLNTAITTLVYRAANTDAGPALLIAKAAATMIVLFWNFFGQKYITFRKVQR